MHCFKSKRRICGSITLYLALTLAVITSLLFCIIESARVVSIKTHCKSSALMAMDSAFSHYASPLYEKYGVLGVFTTEDKLMEQIKSYAEKNIKNDGILSVSSANLISGKVKDISCRETFRMTDKDGQIFVKQVVSFQKYKSLSDRLKDYEAMDKQIDENTTCSPGYIEDGNVITDSKGPELLTDMSGKNSSLYKDYSQKEAEQLRGNIASKTVNLLKSNLLLFFIDNPFSISHTEVDNTVFENLPSAVCHLSETAQAIQDGSLEDFLTSAADKYMFMEYIDSTFSSYISPKQNSDISLKYQREYILCGRQSDDDNLLAAALSMVSLRSAFNLTYLMSDSVKRDTAINLANSVCLYAPVASQIAAFLILSYWSYAEAVIDVHDLFCGKSVPLLKTDETWTLSLEGILQLNRFTVSKNDGKTGYSYEEYLDMCMMLSDSFSIYYRTMDLMELDMRENVNPDFSMMSCFTAAKVTLNYTSSPLFTSVLKSFQPDIYTFSVDMMYGYD